jgi:hypothetical protein
VTRALTIEGNLKFVRRAKGAKRVVSRDPSAPLNPLPLGRIPRIAKLMALAIRWDGLIRSGALKDYAEIAVLCRVSRARITQIMNLNLLAPDIQEAILFLPRVDVGRDSLTLQKLHPATSDGDWKNQRKAWERLRLAV